MKSDNFQNLVLFTLPNLLSHGLSFVIILIAAKSFSNIDFGYFTFAQTLYFILFSLSFSNIYIYLQKELAINFKNRRLDISTCFLIQFFFSFFIIILSSFIIILIDINPTVRNLSLILNLLILSETFSTAVFSYFFVTKKFKLLFKIKMFQLICFFNAKLYFLLFNFEIIFFVTAYLLESIFYSVLLIYFYNKKYNFFNFIINKDYILKIFKKIIILPFVGFAALLSLRIDVLMLSSIDGYISAGIYSSASRTISSILIILFSFFSFIYPQMAVIYKSNFQEYEKTYSHLIISSFLLTIIVFILSLLFGNLYLNYWGKNFINAHNALLVLSLNLFLSLLIQIWVQRKYIEENYYNIFFFQIIFILLNIILNLLFINSYGITGAAIATLFASLFSFLIINMFDISEFKRVYISFSFINLKEAANRIFSVIFR